MRHTSLSYIANAPVSYAVYSAFSFFGSRRGGELPGTWLVRALSAVGHEEATIRQTLLRMANDQELTVRRVGRTNHYRLSAFAEAEVHAGTDKIFSQPSHWDGRWTVVQIRFEGDERIERERVRSILHVNGYGALAPGLFLHPTDSAERLRKAVGDLGMADRLLVFRGDRQSEEDDLAFVRRIWPLERLSLGYRAFVREFDDVARSNQRLSPPDAFAMRFAVVFAYLDIAWDDPGLPLRLLPRDWPGERARRLTKRLYARVLPLALRFGDQLLAETTTAPVRR